MSVIPGLPSVLEQSGSSVLQAQAPSILQAGSGIADAPANGSTYARRDNAWIALASMALQNANSVAITGGAINGTSVGATTPSSGAFTTLSTTSTATTGQPAHVTATASDLSSLVLRYTEQAAGSVPADSWQWRCGGIPRNVVFSYTDTPILAVGTGSLSSYSALFYGTDPGSVAAGRVALGGGVIRSAGAIIAGGSVDANGRFFGLTTSSNTATQPDGFVVSHRTTNTPAAAFGITFRMQAESTTTDDRNQFVVQSEWVDATDATRKSRAGFYVYDTAAREAVRMQASGSAALIGFLGAAAVARQSVGAAAIDAATTQTLANNLRTALINLGLCAT
jgi:hypothetical protein